MSIRDEIARQCEERRLFFLPPAMTFIPVVRHLFVSPELYRLAETGPWADIAEEKRFGLLRANLDDFTRNAPLTVEWNPFEARDAYFGRLDPISDEVWDIRSRDPRPAIRVLGSFADTDTFVGLVWGWRKEWDGKESCEWRDARVRTGAEWRKLFPAYTPHKGDHIHDYLSNAVLA
jgi:hypothetical protein